MEEGKQKKSRKTDDEAEIGQRQFNSDSVSVKIEGFLPRHSLKRGFWQEALQHNLELPCQVCSFRGLNSGSTLL